MARRIAGLLFSLLLCAACWAQSSGAPQPPDKADSSKAAVKEVAQPAAEKAAPDAKAAEAKEATAASKVRLTAVESVVSKTETATGFGQLTCDNDGNVYMGPDDPGAPIRKINAKGELVTSFKPRANPDIDVYAEGHYAVTPDGEVYVHVESETAPHRFILVFKSDGSYSTTIKPETGFSMVPSTIAIFPNGNLLMTGNKLDRNSKLFIVPFTGIFRSDGKLLKEITLEQNESLPDTSAMKDLKPGQPLPIISNRAVAWGHTEPAKDGNIYIMRWGSPASFYAISPGGEVVKRFTVDPGSSAYDPYHMHISGNRIAVQFSNKSFDQIIKIVDLDGQELETYEISPTDRQKEQLGVFACYTMRPERFTFLISDTDYKLKVNQVEAR